LINHYVNELVSVFEQYNITVKYDDVKMYITILDDVYVQRLHLASDAIVLWSHIWQLPIAVY